MLPSFFMRPSICHLCRIDKRYSTPSVRQDSTHAHKLPTIRFCKNFVFEKFLFSLKERNRISVRLHPIIHTQNQYFFIFLTGRAVNIHFSYWECTKNREKSRQSDQYVHLVRPDFITLIVAGFARFSSVENIIMHQSGFW